MRDGPIKEIIRTQAHGGSYSEAGQKIGLTKDKVQKMAQKVQSAAHAASLKDMPRTPELPPEITLQGDVVMMSDLHVLAVRPELVKKARKAGRHFGIKQAAIVGDLFNFDVFSLYPALVVADALQEEIVARQLLVFLMEWYDTITFCRGNHDERVIKKLNGQVDMQMISDLILREEDGAGLRARLVASPHDRLWLRANDMVWLLCHQHEYSQQTLTVANKLAAKYDCNVVTTHQHHFGVGISKYGGHVIADNPCMCDPNRIAYKTLNTNSLPEWAFGFSVIKDGTYLPYVDNQPVGFKL